MSRINEGFPLPDFVSGISIDWLEFTIWRLEGLRREPDLKGGGFNDDGTPGRLSDAEWLDYRAGRLHPEDFLGPLACLDNVARYLLGMQPTAFERADRGLLGYKRRFVCDGVTILEDGTASMGVHVIITGSVVRHLPKSPTEIIRAVMEHGGKFSRIDGAIDDFDGRLPLPAMIERAENGGLCGRLHEFSLFRSGRCTNGAKTGETLYIGKRESQVYFRCYDKFLEQRNKKKIPERYLPKDGKWIRLEVELKGDAAQNFAREASSETWRDEDEQAAACVMGVVKNYLNFREPKPGSTGAKKSRWPVCQWWAEFIADAEKLRVSKILREPTVEKRLRWFRKQCLKTFGVAGVALGSEALTDWFRDGLRAVETDPDLKKQAEKIRQKTIREDEKWKQVNSK